MKRKTIKIKAPKALPGQIVNVLNYRKKGKGYEGGTWEEGVVSDVKYSLRYAKNAMTGYWSYDVRIDDKDGSGKYLYTLDVGDEGIKSIK